MSEIAGFDPRVPRRSNRLIEVRSFGDDAQAPEDTRTTTIRWRSVLRLHAAREAAGISPAGARLPGCSAAYISRIEQGRANPVPAGDAGARPTHRHQQFGGGPRRSDRIDAGVSDAGARSGRGGRGVRRQGATLHQGVPGTVGVPRRVRRGRRGRQPDGTGGPVSRHRRGRRRDRGCRHGTSTHGVQRGGSVLLLERLRGSVIARGSSHGPWGIFRAQLSRRAVGRAGQPRRASLWRELEAERGERLIERVGSLDLDRFGGTRAVRSLRAACACESLGEVEVSERWPIGVDAARRRCSRPTAGSCSPNVRTRRCSPARSKAVSRCVDAGPRDRARVAGRCA